MLKQLIPKKKNAKKMGELWTRIGSSIATITFVYTILQSYLPVQLRHQIRSYLRKLTAYFYHYIQITFHEFEGDAWFKRSKAYACIEQYLSEHSSSQAKRLNARASEESEAVVLSMSDYEEVTDSFQGAKLWWKSIQISSNSRSISVYPREDQRRYFTLTFHRKHKELVTNSYLKYVLEKGKEIQGKQRKRKLFTNNRNESGGGRGTTTRVSLWSHVLFNHPACFDTLAMDAKKKKEIIDDLETFSKSKEYYRRIGKAWKRGYLLFGPPGTGKSTMIAAMANFLEYDVYDIELTAVKDNIELRRLLIDTSTKSIVVIEDIDCSLNLTGHREKQKDVGKATVVKEDNRKNTDVTLSGLLNCIDGLWSTCGEEKIFIFTTNYVDKLDLALIRRGRMDKHIELSYCCFESFKVLAKNYLNLDSHEMFSTVEKLLEETKMTPADIADTLMPKSAVDNDDSCLERLIKALDVAKEEARLKAEEEKKEKAEEEARLKADEEKKEIEEEEKRLKDEEQQEKIKKLKAAKAERERKTKPADISTPKLWSLRRFINFGV